MKEYIEKDAARDLMEQALVDDWEIQYADDRLDEIPAVDAVPVVRCWECEHGEYDDTIEDEYCYRCQYDEFSYYKADYFCSDGERKGGAEDAAD